MTDPDISRTDIDSLAKRLESLDAELSEPERALLSFALKAAADAISHPRPAAPPPLGAFHGDPGPATDEASPPMSSLREQFLDAFSPGTDDQGKEPQKVGNFQINLPKGRDPRS
jgi:hypothetical protein